MLTLLFHLALASSAAALALPQSSGGNSGTQPYPQSTNITYYTGTESDSDDLVEKCGIDVGTEVIESLSCNMLTTSGVGIQQVTGGSCSFTIFHNSEACDSDHISRYHVENGGGVQCFETGVLDGGKFQHASAIWTCG